MNNSHCLYSNINISTYSMLRPPSSLPWMAAAAASHWLSDSTPASLSSLLHSGARRRIDNSQTTSPPQSRLSVFSEEHYSHFLSWFWKVLPFSPCLPLPPHSCHWPWTHPTQPTSAYSISFSPLGISTCWLPKHLYGRLLLTSRTSPLVSLTTEGVPRPSWLTSDTTSVLPPAESPFLLEISSRVCWVVYLLSTFST